MKKIFYFVLFLGILSPVFGQEQRNQKRSQSIQKGLLWLASQQNGNGSFGKIPGLKIQGDVGMTGIVLMAFGNSSKNLQKIHQKTIEKAFSYLLKHQAKNGAIYNPGRSLINYQTSVSAIAMCLIDKKRFSHQISQAKKFIVETQFSESYHKVTKENWNYGGWDYKPKKGKPDSDMSNVQFALEALHEAGLDKKSPTWKRAVTFLSRCQNRSESNDQKFFMALNDGGFMYYPGNSKVKPIKMKNGKLAYPSYASMTYAGLKSFIYAQVEQKDPRVQAALNWIRGHYTLEENYGLGTKKNPKNGQQGLYYYYATFAKALQARGKKTIITEDGQKHSWALELADKIVSLQHKEGFWVNSNPRWWEGDPTLATAYSLIALNIARKNLEKK